MRLRFPLGLLFLLLFVPSARASVQVLPNRAGARLLSPKTVDMRTRVAGGFAATTATWTFSNTATTQIEAEFIAEAPLDAVVTGFAYWFNDEKVIARIVEKARAAEIYAGVVARRRDPALVEMIERNFFRARISPVEAKADLRLEITWVQPLTFEKSDLVLRLPLRRDGERLALARWNSVIEVAAMPQLDSVTSSYDALVEKSASSFKATASGAANVPENLVLRLKPKAGALWPALATTSPSGTLPYYAVLNAHRPTEKALADFRELRAGGGYVSVGRGALPPGNISYKLSNAAEKLWAARRIDDMSRDVKQREATIKLSQRYGLPSRWTSWLAIPTAERARLRSIIEREKIAQALRNIDVLGNRLALEIAAGGTKTRGYALMKKQFEENVRIARTPDVTITDDEWLNNFVTHALENLESQLESHSNQYGQTADAKALRKTNSLAIQMRRLAQALPPQERKTWQNKTASTVAKGVARGKVQQETELLARALSEGKSAPELRKKVETRFAIQVRRSPQSSFDVIARFASEWAKAKDAPRPNAKRIAMLRAQTDRLIALQTKAVPKSSAAFDYKAYYLHNAEQQQFGDRLRTLNADLAQEVVAKRENSARANALRSKLRVISTKLEYPAEIGLYFGDTVNNLVKQLSEQKSLYQPDATKIASLEAELARLKKYADAKYFQSDVENSRSSWAGYQGPQILAQRWIEANYGDNPKPKAAEFYATKLQALLDEKYAAEQKRNPSFPFKRGLATDNLKQAESGWLYDKTRPIFDQLVLQHSAPRPDETKIKALHQQLLDVQSRTVYNQNLYSYDDLGASPESRTAQVFEGVLKNLRAERRKPQPDEAAIASLEKRVIDLQEFDSYYHSWGSTGRKPQDPQEFGKLRIERIAVRASREKVLVQLKKTDAPALRAQEIRLARRENELMVRMGDPLIAVVAPADCRQVIAILPSGEIKKLLFNHASKQWEARFDVPTYANAGAYSIAIIVVAADGTRQQLKLKFTVDLTPPRATGTLVARDGSWLVSIECDATTDRVEAMLPWGARTDLKRSGAASFTARVTPPTAWQGESKVRLILTNRAHNRTEISLDLTQ